MDQLECCPSLIERPACDVLDLRYSLPARAVIGDNVIPVQWIFRFRLERCTTGLAQGDLAYTTTLMPGEQVRLFSSDRHTSWSYDSTSAQSYRNQTTSEVSYLTWGIATAMTNLSISQGGSGSSSTSESWASGGGGGLNLFGLIQIGGGGSGGSYDSSAVYDFARQLSMHASAVSTQVAAGVRVASSTSIGEVQHRAHAQGESEERIESVSRIFSNPNRCHAVTYLFYRLVKLQRIRIHLVASAGTFVERPAGGFMKLRCAPPTTAVFFASPGSRIGGKGQPKINRIHHETDLPHRFRRRPGGRPPAHGVFLDTYIRPAAAGVQRPRP